MKVAIIHHWLVGMRGGERVVEEFVRLYPDADIFTHVADRSTLSPLLAGQRIFETSVARLPGARKHYQKYLAFMPRALEELDLSAYDLVISSESGPSKGVIVPPHARHICYINSPMRYIWDHYPSYTSKLNWLERAYFSRLAHRMRIWDVTSAARVDQFVANSNFIARRVDAYYNRDATVVNPPVDLGAYKLPDTASKREHYIFVSQLVPYKRADLVIEAFRGLDRPLLVVGDGSQREEFKKNLPPNVTLLGRVPNADLPGLYQNARALLFPAEEDFGIVPVEAMACGTPVLAYGRGGARDSVVDGTTGLFFGRQDVASLRDAITRFEAMEDSFDAAAIHAHATRFGAERFRREFSAVVEKVLAH
ncbi:Glycosyltransferase involved in cell wall bisynthesis [Pseudosulfitobacter pseudonitzschiae]|uniref:Glycosyl transferase n=1 Tax=Pseudosulfitobacter pseudonitzschiae TaxID=1402135 RepID=A0A073JCY0_9RHOB|nr:glycosyltransferase [Pseudosulfitobacter pseudonitzschiae]KEJ95567.1 glycosyl transferase [Pseudosulfitobacter pseudonitzschiae]QKS10157.1 glycosyltransferase [Pseudosulfitobacter pseudonitzschiae]SHE83216.1 Glycosyltransferase involved in cell wall bisynthesis [Pseudosulfitobacter pseudonitzschiae]